MACRVVIGEMSGGLAFKLTSGVWAALKQTPQEGPEAEKVGELKAPLR